MKVVVLDTKNTEDILGNFISNGYDDFIVFGKVDRQYYIINGINVTELNGNLDEGTSQRLQKINGSLTSRFFLVFSPIKYSLEKIEELHKESQELATLIIENKKLAGAILEPEIFDYMDNSLSLEKEIFLKVAQDGELQVYN